MKKAFTLIELLICLFIIALLAALIFAATINSKNKARQSTCQSNLRQIGIHITMYRQDYDGEYPSGQAVDDVVVTYINKNKLQCPSAIIDKKYPKNPEIQYIKEFTGYGFNVRLTSRNCDDLPFDAPCKGTISESEVKFPSNTVLAMDQSQGFEYPIGPNMLAYFDPSAQSHYKEKGWQRHSGGANYLFCDGHVKWYQEDQIQPAAPYKGGKDYTNDGKSPSFSIKSP